MASRPNAPNRERLRAPMMDESRRSMNLFLPHEGRDELSWDVSPGQGRAGFRTRERYVLPTIGSSQANRPVMAPLRSHLPLRGSPRFARGSLSRHTPTLRYPSRSSRSPAENSIRPYGMVQTVPM